MSSTDDWLHLSIPPVLLKQYDSIIALDIDGVFAENEVGCIRHTRNAPNKQLLNFRNENPHFFTNRALGKYDVESVSFDSLTLLIETAIKANAGFVIVSSWVTNSAKDPRTCTGVEAIFSLVGIATQKPLVIGQTGGGGGSGREGEFFKWIRKHTERDDPKKIQAIDDSGLRHFPLLHLSRNLVKSNARNGYITDNHFQSINKLDAASKSQVEWFKHGFVPDMEKPYLSRDQMWDLIHDDKVSTRFDIKDLP